MIIGWKPRYIQVSYGMIEIKNNKSDPKGKSFDISSANVLNEKKNEFILDFKDKKIHLKAFSELEKATWLLAIKEQQHLFHLDKQNLIREESRSATIHNKDKQPMPIEKLRYNKDPFRHKKAPSNKTMEILNSVKQTLTELNLAINLLNEYLRGSKKDKKDNLFKIYDNFISVKKNLQSQVEDAVIYVNEVLDIEKSNTSTESINSTKVFKEQDFFEAKESLNDNILQNEIDKKNNEKNLDDSIVSDSSFDDCEEIANTDITFGPNEIRNLRNSICVKAEHLKLFHDSYSFEPRTSLKTVFKSSNSMISDLVKSAMKEKGALPITYNEPLSMLQRQIESFQFYSLLDSASKEKSDPLKLANIAGFAVAEFSLSINRLLKPFNPILGETYEYIDLKHQFRSISEQVSHHPPISAFLVEGKNVFVYGDSKNKHNFLLMKGAIEMNFSSKTHIVIHNSKSFSQELLRETVTGENITNHFVFNKPNFYFKGLIYGTPHYDLAGTVKIEDILSTDNKTDKYYAELEFIEEGKKGKTLGSVEGKIFKNKEVINVLKGNWREGLGLFDKLGEEKLADIWKIGNDSFITNTDTLNNYLMSNFAYNLNYLPKELEICIPHSDSRRRPDQRLFEEGNIEEAELTKKLLEDKQRKRAKEFEAEKKIYKPAYFECVGNKDGLFYVPCKDYWKDRETSNFSMIPDILELEHN